MDINYNINYYKVLGINFNFSHKELKKAYYTLSKKYHPDKKGGDENFFKIITESYKVLSDEELKRRYDDKSFYGKDYNEDRELFNFEFSNEHNKKSKLSEKFNEYKKKGMLNILIELDGFKPKLKYERYKICTHCGGTGFDDISEIECDLCEETGIYNGNECPSCLGDGYVKMGFKNCKKCNGEKVVLIREVVKIRKENFNDENMMIIEKAGNYSKDVKNKIGSLFIKIKDE